jgi:alpha-tubulin suppressor-like RCC1 family protein
MQACERPELLDIPLDVLTKICRHLNVYELVRVAETCKRFRHGGLATVELPTESPVVSALLEHAFRRAKLIPNVRLIGCSASWVAYIVQRARQRRCLEAPPIAAGMAHSVFADATGRLLTCGTGHATGHGDADRRYFDPILVAGMAGIRVRSVAATCDGTLALSWDGRVYSWGYNPYKQLGHEDGRPKPMPSLVPGLEGVRCIVAAYHRSLAVTHSGAVFSWGRVRWDGDGDLIRPTIVEGVGGVRVRRVCAGEDTAFAIGEDGEVFSWGRGKHGLLGNGEEQDQPSPKRIEALRGVRMSTASVGSCHALALAEDGLVYSWGPNRYRTLLGNPDVEREWLPTPVEALRGVCITSIVTCIDCSHAVSDIGEVWAWGVDEEMDALGHGEADDCLLPKPIEALRGIFVHTVAACWNHKLAVADDESVYVWGRDLTQAGHLGMALNADKAGHVRHVRTPRRVIAPGLRVACEL